MPRILSLYSLLFACLLWSSASFSNDAALRDGEGDARLGSAQDWPTQKAAPANAPNIVIILLDDSGFADTSVFGGLTETPHLARLASQGLRYNNFNVTAMCSPTRAALLTGRNHHRVGFGVISEGASVHPGYNSYWKESTASIAEVLRQNGYSTAAFGKWHNTPEWEITPSGPFDRWPTGLGFEYFYGFMGAEDNQWEPNRLYRNTLPIDPPRTPGDRYHLTGDLADETISWLDTHRSFAPEKPYFLYFATGAVHTPHHAPEEWIARYRGKFDRGWDGLREEIFARQKRLGVIPQDTQLTPRPPQIPAWDTLSRDEQLLFARQMEVYAGFMAHTDYQIGRVLDHIRKGPGNGENTLIFYIAGDNGAVGRPLPNYGGRAAISDELARINELGGPMVPFSQSQGGWGWMSNTPFQYWKTIASYFGGTRAPMIVSWPSRIADPGGMRQQFQHVTDIVPTIYDAIGLAPPEKVKGAVQQALDGTSLLATIHDEAAPSTHHTQYFELYGNRAIYHRGWMASTLGKYMQQEGEGDEWALYHVEEDFSQAVDLSGKYPNKVQELQSLFDRLARANQVYPIGGTTWNPQLKPFPANRSNRLDFYKSTARIPPAQFRSFNGSHALEAEVEFPQARANGVLASFGYRNKGFVWYLEDGELIYELHEGMSRSILRSGRRLEAGSAVLRYQFICETCPAEGRALDTIAGTAQLYVDDQLVANQRIESMNLVNGGEAFAMYIGRTGGSRISNAFAAPYFFNGQLKRLSIIYD